MLDRLLQLQRHDHRLLVHQRRPRPRLRTMRILLPRRAERVDVLLQHQRAGRERESE